jgi:hypothetical protein
MMFSRFLSTVYQSVVSAAQQVARTIRRTLFGSGKVARCAANAGKQLLQTAWQRPVMTSALVLSTGLAWSVFGWTPLLSALIVSASVRTTAAVLLWLWRRWNQPSRVVPVPLHPVLQNGRRSHSSVAPAVAAVS